MAKITRRGFTAGVGATALALASRSARADDRTGVTKDAIKIGVLGSLTGPQAIFGTANLSGAQLAFDEANAAGGINGRKIEYVSIDDESSAPKSIAGFGRLVEGEKVFAIFGPSASALAQAMVPTFNSAPQVPVFVSIFSTPAVTEPPLKNVFRTGPLNDRMQGIAIANFCLDELKGKRVAVIHQSDEYGKRGGQSAADRLKERQSPAVAVEVFNLTDTDFTSQLLRIREANPDVLIIYGFPGPAPVITRQTRQLGIGAKIIGSNGTSNLTYPQTVGPAAAGAMNVLCLADLPESDAKPMATFREKFKARFPDLARQNRPDLGDCLGYGGALTFLEALRRAGPELSREGFITALEGIKNFETGITLPTTFGPGRREGNLAMRILEFQPDLSRKLLPQIISVPA